VIIYLVSSGKCSIREESPPRSLLGMRFFFWGSGFKDLITENHKVLSRGEGVLCCEENLAGLHLGTRKIGS